MHPATLASELTDLESRHLPKCRIWRVRSRTALSSYGVPIHFEVIVEKRLSAMDEEDQALFLLARRDASLPRVNFKGEI